MFSAHLPTWKRKWSSRIPIGSIPTFAHRRNVPREKRGNHAQTCMLSPRQVLLPAAFWAAGTRDRLLALLSSTQLRLLNSTPTRLVRFFAPAVAGHRPAAATFPSTALCFPQPHAAPWPETGQRLSAPQPISLNRRSSLFSVRQCRNGRRLATKVAIRPSWNVHGRGRVRPEGNFPRAIKAC